MQSLNSLRFSRVLALCLSPLALVATKADIFIRPAVLYVSPTNSNLSSKTGYSIAAGTSLGATAQHEVSAEVAQVDWELKRGTSIPGIGTTGDGKNRLMLANYRYYFSPSETAFRLYAGVFAGATHRSGDIVFMGSGAVYGGSVSETNVAFGGTAGVSLRLSSSVACDLGYRFLQAESSDVATHFATGGGGFGGTTGPSISLPAASAHVVALSVRISF